MGVPGTGKFKETEGRLAVTSDWGLGGGGKEGFVFNACRVSVWDNEKDAGMDSGDVCTIT